MRLTYSNIVSTIALVAALGGGATAGAAALSRNSVGSAQVRDRSIQTRDLATTARPPSRARIAQAVTDTLTSTDVLTALKGAVRGEQGPAGAQGPQGTQGPAGVAGITIRQDTTPVGAQTSASAAARCVAGERAIGGGGQLDRDGGLLSRSFPLEDGAGWAVVVANQSTEPSTVRAFVVCAQVPA